MSKILIKDVELEDIRTDILIEGNRISRVASCIEAEDAQIIKGDKKAVIPGFVNGHTHAAMTLFRGFGDDMKLMPWLQERIWPNEAKLTQEDIYWGSKLACLEMIKSGTTAFLDMYYDFPVTAGVAEEMGLRAMVCSSCFDHFQPELTEKSKQYNIRIFSEMRKYHSRIKFSLGPHAVYTVSAELLKWLNDFSIERELPIQLHLAETEEEVANCLQRTGYTPVRYLHQLGVLSPRLILSHVIYVDEEEIRILADHGVKVVHNPASNMKLASGMKFRYTEMRKMGITVGLGTDGCASSNNLDMVEAMKLASLLGKVWRKDPEAVPASEIFDSATVQGAEIFGIPAGKIEEGMLADLCLVDLAIPAFTPNFNFVSNLVYAANGSCIDTVICDGEILMRNKKVPGEEEIMEKAAERAYRLVGMDN